MIQMFNFTTEKWEKVGSEAFEDFLKSQTKGELRNHVTSLLSGADLLSTNSGTYRKTQPKEAQK